VGFAAWLILLALAATSFNRAVRWLGGRRCQALHRAVYAVAALAILHFVWMRSGKQDFAEVWVYALVLAALMGWRLWRKLRSQPERGAAHHTAELPPVSVLKLNPPPASFSTLIIDGGKRDKIRPTDVLGALTGSGELERSDVGNIRITHQAAYVAVSRNKANLAKQILSKGKIKGKTARVREL
jgi:hypothetical protein